MQLVNIKLQGEKMANEKIKELVLTVPAFWSEQERKAIINAADLAGMKVSTLIHDGLAGTTTTYALLTSSCDRLLEHEDIHGGTTVPFNLRYGCWINNCNSRVIRLPHYQRG